MGKVVPIRQPDVSIGLMHVWQVDGEYQVAHESASGGSFGLFERFDDRDHAIAFALRQIPKFGRCKLGEIAS
jgi:hypothetical protein